MRWTIAKWLALRVVTWAAQRWNDDVITAALMSMPEGTEIIVSEPAWGAPMMPSGDGDPFIRHRMPIVGTD